MSIKRVFLDVETTGLDPNINGIWQIGAILDVDGKILGEFNQKMTVFPSKKVDNMADLTGSNFEFLKDLPLASEGLRLFKAWLKSRINPYDKSDKAIFIGYNTTFDYQFMRQWFLDGGDKYFGSWFWFPYIDVMQLAGYIIYELNARKGMVNFKLATVAQTLGINIEGITFHDALDDVKVTRDIYYLLDSKLEIHN